MNKFLRMPSLSCYLKKNSIMPKSNKSYPCLCEISKNVLFVARIAGILPIRSVLGKDIRKCSFVTSNYMIAYSVILQIVYFIYFCFVYSVRLYCSQDKSYKDTDWYLMAVGFLITDLDTMVVLLLGVVRSKRICRILERLSKLDSSITRDKDLKANINRVMWIILLYLGIKIFSFLHNTHFLTTFKSSLFAVNCSSLEATFAVLVRGFTVLFPTIQIAIVHMLVVLVEEKFEYLADSVAITVQNMGVTENELCGLICVTTSTMKEENQIKKENKLEKPLDRLADMHLEIFSIVDEINYCIGFQLLIGNCSSLYTMIYYLYRYITFTIDRNMIRSLKMYYALSLLYRLVKVIGYMVLGQRLYTKSLLPLRTIQKARITNLPTHLQQQLQTLMMQWSGKEAYLTACGIVNFGLWLLAPIAGNIITYLLVALQFDDISTDANATSIIS